MLRGDVDGVHEALFSLVEGDMHLDENGVFAEVALDRPRPSATAALRADDRPGAPVPGNHLPRRVPAARLLLIRQYLYDWGDEPVAAFIDRARRHAPASRHRRRRPTTWPPRSTGPTRWVERSIDYWAAYIAASRDLLDHNTFTAPNTPPGGAPSIAYGGGCWDLGPDQALVIEHDVPDAHYWNWSIHNLHWFDSGAWDERLMSCNGRQAHVDDDGKVRLVVAHADPGVPELARHRGRGRSAWPCTATSAPAPARSRPRPWSRSTRCGPRSARRPPDRVAGGSAAPARRSLPCRPAALELSRPCRWTPPPAPAGSTA